MLQVLAVKNSAISLDRRRNDKTVVPGEMVMLLETQSLGVEGRRGQDSERNLLVDDAHVIGGPVDKRGLAVDQIAIHRTEVPAVARD
jgi:hypothetical protein